MRNTLAIAYYELKRLFRDWRLILIVISQPLVVALIAGLVVYKDPDDIKVGLIIQQNNEYSQRIENELLESTRLKIKNYQNVKIDDIKAGKIRGFVILDIKNDESISGRVDILDDPSGGTIKLVVEAEVAKAITTVSKDIALENVRNKIDESTAQLPAAVPKIEIDNKLVDAIETNSKDATPFTIKHFDYFASAMMALLVLLVVLNLSGISITNERVSGTFERLSSTPFSKINIIFGKAMAQFLIGMFVMVSGILSCYLIFNISLGNIYLLTLVNLLIVADAVTLGLLISSITYTVVESVELAMYMFFISVLTGSILAPLETSQKYFAYFMKITPFYYTVDASRRINMLDAGWQQVSHNVYILIGFFLVFLTLSVLLLRREAK